MAMGYYYYNTRKRFNPEVGKIYENLGGGLYRCLMTGECVAVMQNVVSSWTFIAHGCGMYENELIDWDYSTDGKFMKEDRPCLKNS